MHSIEKTARNQHTGAHTHTHTHTTLRTHNTYTNTHTRLGGCLVLMLCANRTLQQQQAAAQQLQHVCRADTTRWHRKAALGRTSL